MTDTEESIKENLRIKKKTKIFNKIYTDMQNSINTSLKRNYKVHAISNYRSILKFEKDIDSNYKLYEDQDEKLFDKSIILQRIFSPRPKLSNKNKEIVWKYIQNMYSLIKEENKQLEVKSTSRNSDLEGLVNNLMADENSGFKSIVDEISTRLEKATVGKKINENTILSDLMSGNLQSSGIDFKKIIEDTSKTLEKKIKNGEIDHEKIMKTSDDIKNTLNMKL